MRRNGARKTRNGGKPGFKFCIPQNLKCARKKDGNAVYGYSPNPSSTSRIRDFANGDLYDWSNPDKVNIYRERRIQYHKENDNIDRLIIEMKKK